MIARSLPVVIIVAAVTAHADASPRSPIYVEGGVSSMVHPLAGDGWSPLSIDLKLGVGGWFGQRVGLFAQVGFASELSREDPGIAQTGAVVERLRFATGLAGVKLNVWPRRSWLQLDLVAAARAILGNRDLLIDGAVASRRDVRSVGPSLGLELDLVKFKSHGVAIAAAYHLQRTDLGDATGAPTMGVVDLGGIELTVTFQMFLGAPE